MITKFRDSQDPDKVIEFSNVDNELNIFISEFEPNEKAATTLEVNLTKENLFELIGQLLRIQSIIKKQ